MAYTVNQIKVFAYNKDEQKDFTPDERHLYKGLRHCYDCFRAGYDKEECTELMQKHIDYFTLLTNYAEGR